MRFDIQHLTPTQTTSDVTAHVLINTVNTCTPRHTHLYYYQPEGDAAHQLEPDVVEVVRPCHRKRVDRDETEEQRQGTPPEEPALPRPSLSKKLNR